LSGLLAAVSAIETVLQQGAPAQTPGVAAVNALPDEPVLL
jgi:uncharacterized protein